MKIFRKVFPFLFLATLVCFIFYKIIFLGQIYYDAFDNFRYVSPEKFYLIDQIRQGIFPLWNPYLFIGIPYFADITLGTLSLFNFLYFLFPAAQAVALTSALDIFLIGCFQYIFLRYLKISKISSLISATVFAFAGTPFIHIGDIAFLTVIVYIPILFFLMSLLIEKKTYHYFFLLIIFQILQLLSGHPRITYYTILFLSFYFLYWSNFPWKKKFVIIFFYYVFTIAVSAIQLLPFIEYAFRSNRPLSDLSYASSSSLSLEYIITFFFPTFFGTHLEGTWWGPQTMLFGYMGIPSYVSLCFGIVKGYIAKKSFYLISLFMTLLLAVGSISPVYLFFYFFVPGWKVFRAPIDIMVYFTFFATVLIGIGYDYLFSDLSIIRNMCKRVIVPIVLVFIPLGIVFVFIGSKKYFWQTFFLAMYKKMHIHMISRLLIYDPVKLQVMFQGMFANIILLLLFCIITCCFYIYISKNKKILGFMFLFFTAITFIYYDSKILSTAPLSFLSTNEHVPTILQDAQNGNYRILSLPVNLHQMREHLAIPDFFYKESLANLSIYISDNNIDRHLYQINGATPLIPDTYAHFIAGKVSEKNVTTIDFNDITQEQLNLSSVKYIITHEPIGSFPAKLFLKEKKTNSYYIYENPYVKKRAYILHNPLGSSVQIVHAASDNLIIHATVLHKANLVISNWAYPGWIATVNGKKTDILSYMGTFQQIVIPGGNSIIILSYKPESFIIGMWVTIISLCLLIYFFIVLKNSSI